MKELNKTPKKWEAGNRIERQTGESVTRTTPGRRNVETKVKAEGKKAFKASERVTPG